MNVKFIIEYDGTHYHGWQMQKNVQTIQGELNRAFQILLPNEHINIIGSGRTDTGVHAYNQVASVKLPLDTHLDNFFNSVNGIINNDIYIKSYIKIDEDFNARFSAKFRTYKYFISTQYSPFKHRLSWYINYMLDIQKLHNCADAIIGEHNFSLLSKNNAEIKNKHCIIYESYWEQNKNDLIYHIKANRFLHHMVRFIVGSSIEVSKSKLLFDDFNSLINNQAIKVYPTCAPAEGLFLSEILYE